MLILAIVYCFPALYQYVLSIKIIVKLYSNLSTPIEFSEQIDAKALPIDDCMTLDDECNTFSRHMGPCGGV